MNTKEPNEAQKAFREALVDTMRKHVGTLSAPELLAVAAHLVGQIMAIQDRRTMTPAMAIELVSRNLEQGNQEAVQQLLFSTGGTA